ncbi:MAG: sigma-70 family RNA polymerase sigma factor [Emcibacter sp.]|nr:sigma-70 family RNA polymerase sigma factor [Emcibacter sp.]
MDHRVELVNYANRIVRDTGHAEDVVQEAYLRFNVAVHDHFLEKPVGYLYRIVRNLAIDGRRRIQREERHIVSGADVEMVEIPEKVSSPEAVAAARAELRVMQGAMAELPERTRIALEMHRFDGIRLKDIARHLGISVGLAHSLVVDGLEHCRERLYRSS